MKGNSLSRTHVCVSTAHRKSVQIENKLCEIYVSIMGQMTDKHVQDHKKGEILYFYSKNVEWYFQVINHFP